METRQRKSTGTFHAVYQQDSGWWIGWLTDLPGANGQGHTLDEARESLRDAADLILCVGGSTGHVDDDDLIGEDAIYETLAL